MTTTTRIEIAQRNILANGVIEVRQDTIVEEDGVEVARTYHRSTYPPGSDVSTAHPAIRRIAALEHTPDVIAAYEALLARGRPELPRAG